jgi:hypothetical protein
VRMEDSFLPTFIHLYIFCNELIVQYNCVV